ncbi:hypothetical protein F4678DRAFT_430158 [Xylaria arbuscula]|nr:hypothetical protein F4678DRAFT_430158 [Xylaria arbuscula]
MTSYMAFRAWAHHFITNIPFYFSTLGTYILSTKFWASFLKPLQIISPGDFKGFHIGGKRNGAVQAPPSTSSQRLSIDTVIAIISLISAVVIVPILSKYWAHWIGQRYQQSRMNRTSNLSSGSSRSQT